MKIAVASGKGGTGKTTIALNLVHTVSKFGQTVQYIDCDVEEPNGHLFLKPEIKMSRSVGIQVPEVNEFKCKGCGDCQTICQFNAIGCINKLVLVFPELCHGCGGCKQVCPKNAITEKLREIGIIEIGTTPKADFVHGKLHIGEAMAPPLIREVLKEIKNNIINIIDAPPGTSCPVITAINDSDFVILVTEPTPFGLNDLGLAIDMIKEIGLPYGVVVNRHNADNPMAREFCEKRNVSILAEIPDDRRVAEAYSIGRLACETILKYENYFIQLWQRLQYSIQKMAFKEI